MKKKAIALMTIPALALGVLTGCGSGDKVKEKDVTLSVQVEDKWLPYYEKVKETVGKEHPNAKIEFIKTGSFDHLDVISKTDPTNKDVADVFALPADRLYDLEKNNVLAPIDAEGMAEKIGGFKDFKSGLGGNFNIDGDYLAFPYNIETLIAFVNVENAKKAGIDYTKSIEFTELQYNEILAVVLDSWFGVAFANSANFDFLSKDKDGKLHTDGTKSFGELTDDQKKLFEGLYTYWKQHDNAGTDLWDKDAAWGYMDSQFKTGGTDAIKIDGPWATPSVKELVGSAENLAVIPLTNITFNGKPLTHWKGGWGLAVNARVEEDKAKMDVATSFIEELVNPANAKDLFKATGKILENVDPSAYEGIDELDKKVIDATYAGYEKSISRPLFTEYTSVAPSWQNAILSWSSTKPANAEAAYKEVQASFKAMMSNYKK